MLTISLSYQNLYCNRICVYCKLSFLTNRNTHKQKMLGFLISGFVLQSYFFLKMNKPTCSSAWNWKVNRKWRSFSNQNLYCNCICTVSWSFWPIKIPINRMQLYFFLKINKRTYLSIWNWRVIRKCRGFSYQNLYCNCICTVNWLFWPILRNTHK